MKLCVDQVSLTTGMTPPIGSACTAPPLRSGRYFTWHRMCRNPSLSPSPRPKPIRLASRRPLQAGVCLGSMRLAERVSRAGGERSPIRSILPPHLNIPLGQPRTRPNPGAASRSSNRNPPGRHRHHPRTRRRGRNTRPSRAGQGARTGTARPVRAGLRSRRLHRHPSRRPASTSAGDQPVTV